MEWMRDYYVWDSKDEGNTCVLAPIQGLKKTYRLTRAENLEANWPDGVYFPMDPEYPKDIALADNLQNFNAVVVVSKALKVFLQKKRLKNVQYLPVAIMNHKGRIASPDYFIVNPIIPQDCLDLERSKPEYYEIKPDLICYVKHLVIDPKRLDPEVYIFRPKNFWSPVLIRSTLANEISDSAFTGLGWQDPLERHR